MQNDEIEELKANFKEAIKYVKETNASVEEINAAFESRKEAFSESEELAKEYIKGFRKEIADTIRDLRKDPTVTKEQIKEVVAALKEELKDATEVSFTKDILGQAAEFIKERIVEGVTEGNERLIEALTPDDASGLVEPKPTMTPWPTPLPLPSTPPAPPTPTPSPTVSPPVPPAPTPKPLPPTPGKSNTLTVFRTDSSGKVTNRKDLNVKKQAGFVTAISDDSKIIEWLEKIYDAIKSGPGFGGSLVTAMKRALAAPFKALGNFLSAPIKALQSKIVAVKDAALAPFKKGWEFIKGIGAKLTESLKAGINKVKNVFGFGTVSEDQFRLKSIDYYKKSLKWQKSIGRKFDNLLKLLSKKSNVKAAGAPAGDSSILGVVGGFVTTLMGAISKGFTDLFSAGGKLLSTLGSSITSLFSTLFKMGGPVLGVVGAAFAGWKIGELVVKPWIDDIVKFVTGDATATLGTALYDAVQNIKSQATRLVDSVKNAKPEALKTDEEKSKDKDRATKLSKVQELLKREIDPKNPKELQQYEKRIKELSYDDTKLNSEYERLTKNPTKVNTPTPSTPTEVSSKESPEQKQDTNISQPATPSENKDEKIRISKILSEEKPMSEVDRNIALTLIEKGEISAKQLADYDNNIAKKNSDKTEKPEGKQPLINLIKDSPMGQMLSSLGIDISNSDLSSFVDKPNTNVGGELNSVSKSIETHKEATQEKAAHAAVEMNQNGGTGSTTVNSSNTTNLQTIVQKVDSGNYDNTYMFWVTNSRRNMVLSV